MKITLKDMQLRKPNDKHQHKAAKVQAVQKGA